MLDSIFFPTLAMDLARTFDSITISFSDCYNLAYYAFELILHASFRGLITLHFKLLSDFYNLLLTSGFILV